MVDLFRYVELRAPDKADADAIQITGESALRNDLTRARASENAAGAFTEIGRRFAASADFAATPGALRFSAQYDGVVALAGSWVPGGGTGFEDRVAAIFQGRSPDDVAQSPDFLGDKTRTLDSLIAVKILGPEYQDQGVLLLRYARGIHIVERAAAGPLIAKAEEARKLLDLMVAIPEQYLPPRKPLAAPTQGSGGGTQPEADLQQRRQSLVSAYNYLTGLDATAFAVPAERAIASAPLSLGPNVDIQATVRSGTAERQLFLKQEIAGHLPQAAHTVLAELRLDAARTPLTQLISVVKGELDQVQRQQLAIAPLTALPVFQVGHHFFSLSKPMTVAAAFLETAPKLKIQPIGFGDLQIVKQQILRYEAAEISYVENVMRGEHFERKVERRELQDELTVTEQERIKEDERDLQSTDRFELHTESENTARDSTTTTAGNTVTTHYGGLVESRASDFARDVVNRTVSKLTERVRELRSLRIQREFIEKTEHGVDNTNHANTNGVYQWVDKVYQAQVFNYGKRLLYEAVIPEPAVFLIEMKKRSGQPEDTKLMRPPEPTFGPRDLQSWNYLDYAKLYDVVGAVEPPPDEYVQVAKGFKESYDTDKFLYTLESIPIPAGYTADTISYYLYHYHYFTGSYLSVAAGSTNVFANTWTLSGETSELPMYIAAMNVGRFVLNIMVQCRRTGAHLEKWQIRTHEALMKGYRKQLSDFQESLANQQALARTQMLLGAGGEQDRDLERTELKKAFLSLLTNQEFDAMGAIETSFPDNYPQTDIVKAMDQSGFISFFERAFEWENMVYFFYPYFWGRKSVWQDSALREDGDPVFQAFLKAGAARIVVPVRPGFEAAVAYYVETGQVWLGAGIPDMYSPLFVDILQEIKDRDKAPGQETPVGDPWEVRLPTSLVLLRENAGLPEWEQNPKGEWVPKP